MVIPMRPFLLFSLIVFSVDAAHASARKPSPITVRLHAEGQPGDGKSFTTPITLINPPKKITIRKVPIVSERDFTAFYPFPATDGSIGAYFKLDANGAHKLESHTTEFRDTMVVALIQGRVAATMRVDAKITDGILMIPSGFLPEEILQLQTKLPTIGKEKEFQEQKEKAEAEIKSRKELERKQESQAKAKS